MAGQMRRIMIEVRKLREIPQSFILEKAPDEDSSKATNTRTASSSADSTSNIIIGRILPKSAPYSQGSYQVEIKIPTDFPFKPPEVKFLTQIYHPNVDKEGKICVDLLNTAEAWKPTTPIVDIVNAVIKIIDDPKIDHALNADIAQQYQTNRTQFNKTATEYVNKHALPRT